MLRLLRFVIRYPIMTGVLVTLAIAMVLFLVLNVAGGLQPR
jgi:hypothetical protein